MANNSTIYRGSEWRKWDLHIHTPYSYDWDGSCKETAEDIVKKAKAENLSVIAVTDHHTIKGIDEVVKAAKGKDITILPGVELRTDKGNKGIHIIGLFDSSTTSKTIYDKLLCPLNLSENDIKTKGDKDIYCDFEKACKKIHELGGLVLLHAGNKSNGIEQLDSDVRATLKKDLAFLVDIFEVSAQKQVEDYRKIVFPKIKQEFPCIITSDACDRSKLQYKSGHSTEVIGKKYSWIKADPTFEGLKQIIYEPEERVYVEELDPRRFTHQFIESFIVEDDAVDRFFIRKNKIYFNPGLTVVIGPRGAGKSVFLDSVALAGDKKEVNPDSYVSSFLAKEGSESSLICSLNVQGGSGGQIVNYKWTSRTPHEERLYFDYFHQKEVGRLAEERVPEAKKQLSDFIFSRILGGPDASTTEEVENDKITILADLARNREDIKEKENLIANEQKIDQQLADLQKQLSAYSRTEFKDVYESRNQILRLQERFKTQISNVERRLERIDDFLRKFALHELEDIKTILDDYDEKNAEQIKEEFKKDITNVLTELETSFNASKQTLEKLNQALHLYMNKLNLDGRLSSLQSELQKKFEELEMKFEDDIQKQIADIQKNINELQAEVERIKKAKQEKQELLQIRRSLVTKYLQKLDSAERNLNGVFDSFCQQDGEILNETITIEFYRDIDSTTYINIIDQNQKLREGEGGRKFPRAKLEEIFKEVKNVQEIIDVFRSKNYKPWSKIKGIAEETIAYFEAIENNEEIAMLLEESLPSLRATIKWRDKYGNYKPLSECSVGERSTALLSIILASGRTPLLIDQPEEDLDNFYISEQLIPIIKTVKKRRQLFFVTHNANIVVNGDAELILILKSQDGKHAEITPTSIEDLSKRKEVVEILEGGKDAFAKREQKLNPKAIE